MSTIHEDDFLTQLSDGSEIPVRELGEHLIIAYDHIPSNEFLEYVNDLLKDSGDSVSLFDEEDVVWSAIARIDFSEEVPSVAFDTFKEDALPVTYVCRW